MCNLKNFEYEKISCQWDEDMEQWYFSIVDVFEVLTESPNPQVYWRVLKKRLRDEGNETVTNCNALKMESANGKFFKTNIANTEQLFQFSQLIPSLQSIKNKK